MTGACNLWTTVCIVSVVALFVVMCLDTDYFDCHMWGKLVTICLALFLVVFSGIMVTRTYDKEFALLLKNVTVERNDSHTYSRTLESK